MYKTNFIHHEKAMNILNTKRKFITGILTLNCMKFHTKWLKVEAGTTITVIFYFSSNDDLDTEQ